MGQPTVGMHRIEPQLAMSLLPAAFAACADPEQPIAEVVLVAAVVGPEALRGRDRASLLGEVRVAVGDDYVDGFVDGFGCVSAVRGRSRGYVHGLDDAAALREALRNLGAEWAWAILEHTQPRP